MNNVIDSLRIETGKFTSEEQYLILKAFPYKEESMRHYQEANYFRIHKLYYRGFFMGYVVLFPGYKSLNTDDVEIDDIGFLRNEELLKPLMYTLLRKIKRHKVLAYADEKVSYNPIKFDDVYVDMFKLLDFNTIEREICRA